MPKAPPKVGAPRPKRKAWTGNNATKRTMTGRALQRERRRLFDADPLCQACRVVGKTTIATIRDHIVPLAFGGLDVPENTQGLCGQCHDAKSRQEAIEGARRRR
jgi:5-methylcytosine-specific restriction protein A